MKYAIVILDGASGQPLHIYGGKTTLEAAHAPHLDRLAQAGTVGLALNVPRGMDPSSNVACTSIMGYNPADYPIGRGALELAALGVELADGQVAMRVNLSNVSREGIMHSYSTDNVGNEDAHAIADELKEVLDDDTFMLYKGTGFRLYLVVSGHPELMDTTFEAAHNFADMPVAEHRPKGPAAALIMDYQARAKVVLDSSAVNAKRKLADEMQVSDIFAFWPGVRPDGMEDFATIYNKRAAVNSGVDLLNGIAQLTGIRRYKFAGVTDGPSNDYVAQANGALKMLDENDVVFVHIEAPDAEAHDGNIEGKRMAVEAIDREIISRLIDYGEQCPLRILALPDHPTPVLTKRHSPDPVPFIMCGPGIAANAAMRLTETEARASGVLVDPGYKLLERFLG